MDWNIIIEYIRPELFILIPFLWWIGYMIKASPMKVDWLIPFILTGLGVILSILWLAVVLDEGFLASVILYGLVQGGLVASVAVLGNEGLKQITRKRVDDQGGNP